MQNVDLCAHVKQQLSTFNGISAAFAVYTHAPVISTGNFPVTGDFDVFICLSVYVPLASDPLQRFFSNAPPGVIQTKLIAHIKRIAAALFQVDISTYNTTQYDQSIEVNYR